VAGPLTKYRFDGIGAASAKLALAALAANPGTAFLTAGISGRIVNWLLTKAFSMAASGGLVLLNVGAAKVETLVAKNEYDGSWDSAEKLLQDARNAHHELTPAEIAAIDGPVIDSFRKFANLAKAQQ